MSRHVTPLPRRNVVYFSSGAYVDWQASFRFGVDIQTLEIVEFPLVTGSLRLWLWTIVRQIAGLQATPVEMVKDSSMAEGDQSHGDSTPTRTS